MDKQKLLQKTFLIIILASISILLCYFFVDQSIATEISQHHLRSYIIFKNLSKLPELYILIAVIVYLSTILRYGINRWTRLDQRLLTFANGIAITHFLKDFFKFVFGRTWPETWINNPSFIQDGVYGFNCFQKGPQFGAFPSGHAAVLLAGSTLLWLLYPRFRIVYLLIIVAGVIGILGMNYHFVSDVIAGGVLGYLVALYTFQITLKERL